VDDSVYELLKERFIIQFTNEDGLSDEKGIR